MENKTPNDEEGLKITLADDPKYDSEFLRTWNRVDFDIKSVFLPKKKYYLICMEIVNNGEKRVFQADYFLDMIVKIDYEKLEGKKIVEQLKILSQINIDVWHWITLFKNQMTSYKPTAEYIFDDIINQIKVGLDCCKLELEAEKLDKENRLFTVPLIIAGLALAISILPYIDKWFMGGGSDKSDAKKIILIQEAQSNEPKLPNENSDSLSEKSEAIP